MRSMHACMQAGCSQAGPARLYPAFGNFATPSAARRRGRAMAQPNDLAWGPGAQGWESALVRRAPTTFHARRSGLQAPSARSCEKRALPSDPCSPRTPRRVALGTETPRAQLSASLAWLEDGTGAAKVLPADGATVAVPGDRFADAAAATARASAPRRRGGAATCKARLGSPCALAGSAVFSVPHACARACENRVAAPPSPALHASRAASMSSLRLAPLGTPPARVSAAAASLVLHAYTTERRS